MNYLISQMKKTSRYKVSALIIIIAFYSVYFIPGKEVVCLLGSEDNFFEYLTAIFFLAASIIFLMCYFSMKNLFFLLLSIVMFIGSGEEISWGQRIIGYSTPDFISDINVQGEFTLHNIEIFNAGDFQGNLKTGLSKLTSINYLYKLFWLTYCVLLPVASFFSGGIFFFLKKVKLPVPPLSLGILFLINWLIFRVALSFLLPVGETLQYYDAIAEIRECASSLLFMIASLYFFRTKEINGNVPMSLMAPQRLDFQMFEVSCSEKTEIHEEEKKKISA